MFLIKNKTKILKIKTNMKISKDYKFKRVIPSTLHNNLQSIILPEGVTLEDLIMLSALILRLRIKSNEEDSDYVTISKTIFETEIGERKIGTKKLYSVCLELLKQYDIISEDLDCKYVVGSKCKGYMVNFNQYDEKESVIIEIQNNYLNNKTRKNIESVDRENSKLVKNVIKMDEKSVKNYKQMEFDYEGAINYLNYIYDNKIPYKGKVMTMYAKQHIDIFLKYLKEGDRNIKVCQTNGRVDTDITNLRGDFRQFIKGDDLKIIDCANSQPLLILSLIDLFTNPIGVDLEKHILHIIRTAYGYKTKKDIAVEIYKELQTVKRPLESEMVEYRKVVEGGKFYEYIQDWFYKNRYNIYDKNDLHLRDNIKVEMFKVLYGIEGSDVFSSIFPNINRYINNIKRILIEASDKLGIKEKKARMFPIIMQGIESYLWIQLIQPKLSDLSITYYGIHDSVIVKNNDVNEALNIINSVYNEYRLYPSLSIEDINKKSLLNIKNNKQEIKKRKIGIEGLF